MAPADSADEATRSLERKKALDAEDFGSSCLVVDSAATHSGGVVTCHLTAQTLVWPLNQHGDWQL